MTELAIDAPICIN